MKHLGKLIGMSLALFIVAVTQVAICTETSVIYPPNVIGDYVKPTAHPWIVNSPTHSAHPLITDDSSNSPVFTDKRRNWVTGIIIGALQLNPGKAIRNGLFTPSVCE